MHRASEIRTEIEKLNLKIALHSEKPDNLKDIDIYLVDTFGETNIFHQLEQLSF